MPGIVDVAKASGVSPATVSQVLGGGKRPVRAATRARVLEVAQTLGYQPNAIARGLVKKRMNTLGVVIQHSAVAAHTNPTLASILDGILAVATRRHQYVTLVTYASWQEVQEGLPTLTDGRCDGVLLVVPPDSVAFSSALVESKMPFVLVGAHSADPRVSCVDIDNIAAAGKAVAYLLEQGHRRIAFFSDVEGAHQFVDERIIGYRQALAAAGVPLDPSLIATKVRLEQDLMALMERPPDVRPTALFCATDACALSVLHHLAERGLRVPQDLSVAGFDDIFAAATSRPPLTTVRQATALAGERAAELLLARINGAQEAGIKICLPTELVIRSSVAEAGSASITDTAAGRSSASRAESLGTASSPAR